MLYDDKKFLLKSHDNLTFDGSSIRGFTARRESDLRLGIDWPSFYWAPADVFGPGKVMVFGVVIDKDGSLYSGDLRSRLKSYANAQFDKNGYPLNAANEIEGFLFKGANAERTFHENERFEFANTGGYYQSLPGDPLLEIGEYGGGHRASILPSCPPASTSTADAEPAAISLRRSSRETLVARPSSTAFTRARISSSQALSLIHI